MDTGGTPGSRAWLRYAIWATGTLAYVMAVASRSSVGVAGVAATERYAVAASTLSTLMIVQFAVYAGAQIPVGVALDRFGSRKVLATGMAVITIGQLAMAFAPTFPLAVVARLLVGLGDAATWISVIRLIAAWFPSARVPFFTQVSAAVGQTGQIISAVPMLGLLLSRGWTAAFGFLGILAGLLGVVIAIVVRDYPQDRADLTDSLRQRPPLAKRLHGVVTTPGAWLGFFTHWVTLFATNSVLMLWGFPFLTQGHRIDPLVVGGYLSIGSVVGAVTAPITGLLTGRFPRARARLTLITVLIMLAIWLVFLVPDSPAPSWRVVLLMIAVGLGGPACAVGFDMARTSVPFSSIGSASGFVNVGGYTSSLLAVWVIGVVLDLRTDATVRSLDDYRVAFASQGIVLILGMIGFFIAWRAVRRGYRPGTNAPQI